MNLNLPEPQPNEEDTQPVKPRKRIFDTHGLDVAFLENKAIPNKRLAVFRGVALYVLKFHGWREISQEEYEARSKKR